VSGDLWVGLADSVMLEKLVQHLYESPNGMAFFNFDVRFREGRFVWFGLWMGMFFWG
jgi:hypothetical protein